MPNEDGSYPDAHHEAIEAGYESREDQLDNQTYCGIDVIGMNSARQLPMDRGSLVFGTRWFDQRLDVGTRLNYSAAGGPEDFDFDLWPSYVGICLPATKSTPTCCYEPPCLACC
ncbi:MAG: hypothetical protein JJT87_13505 [Halomonas sp.]|nr:hypothetical protein [Halomonas sp.]MCC5902927.1 hypothetical protein [Halomonas sp.]